MYQNSMLNDRLLQAIRNKPELVNQIRFVPPDAYRDIQDMNEKNDLNRRAKAQLMSLLPPTSNCLRELERLELSIAD